MKAGQTIQYVDAGGALHEAIVKEIVGNVPSGVKILDITVDGATVEGVHHVGDQDEGAGFWLLTTETQPAPSAITDPPAPAWRSRRTEPASEPTSTDPQA